MRKARRLPGLVDRQARLRFEAGNPEGVIRMADKSFIDGVLYACQELVISHGQDTLAAEIMQASGTREEFLKAQKRTITAGTYYKILAHSKTLAGNCSKYSMRWRKGNEEF